MQLNNNGIMATEAFVTQRKKNPDIPMPNSQKYNYGRVRDEILCWVLKSGLNSMKKKYKNVCE